MNFYQLIIFDLDGTLLDTVEEIAASMNDVMSEFGLPRITLNQAKDWVGKGAPHFIDQALLHHALTDKVNSDDLLARFYDYYEKRSGTASSLYPGVRETLEALHSHSGFKLAVVTNKFKRGADKVLKTHRMTHFFHDVIGGDSFDYKKPEPIAVNFLMQKYSLNPEQVLFIGDSSTDVSTARNAGVDVWAVPYGYNHGVPIADSKPDRVISHFSIIQSLLIAD